VLLGAAAMALLGGSARADKLIPYTGAVVTYTAPTTGTYQFKAFGGQGGGDLNGGLGAEVGGSIMLTAGEKLLIAVGGQGGFRSIEVGGGGGGGTFVFIMGQMQPLLVAGGGGSTDTAGGSGQSGTSGQDGTGLHGGAGGINGNGGSGGSSINAGGGGWFADGTAGMRGGGGGLAPPTFVGGGAGLAGSGAGAFGGGGGASDDGGGGGGYSGGGGGNTSTFQGGGGGGSYINMLFGNTVDMAGVNNGNGFVDIVEPAEPAAPEPSTFVLMGGVGLGLLGYVWRKGQRAA
jgi:hypothetical protein